MKRILVLALIVFLAGCMTVRTYEIEKPRVDTDIKGNQGFLSGAPTEEQKENRLGDTRTISVLELEFRPGKKEAELEEEAASQDVVVEEEIYVEEVEDVYSEELIEPEYKYYTVQKNDTLQKISSKFYGTTRKWKKIYDANTDVIKNPDRLYPGTEIRIPVLQ